MVKRCGSTLAIAMAGAAVASHASADFRVERGPDAPQASPPVETAPAAAPTPPPDSKPQGAPAESPLAKNNPDARDRGQAETGARFRLAAGFGQGVPLAFAARQIVPASVTVRFGRGVDRQAEVNWAGGRPWNRVLASAIAPLGLRMTTGSSTVLISR